MNSVWCRGRKKVVSLGIFCNNLFRCSVSSLFLLFFSDPEGYFLPISLSREVIVK